MRQNVLIDETGVGGKQVYRWWWRLICSGACLLVVVVVVLTLNAELCSDAVEKSLALM